MDLHQDHRVEITENPGELIWGEGGRQNSDLVIRLTVRHSEGGCHRREGGDAGNYLDLEFRVVGLEERPEVGKGTVERHIPKGDEGTLAVPGEMDHDL